MKHNIYKDRIGRMYKADKCSDGGCRILMREEHYPTWSWGWNDQKFKTIMRAQYELERLAAKNGWKLVNGENAS